jgi:hypothetical protein
MNCFKQQTLTVHEMLHTVIFLSGFATLPFPPAVSPITLVLAQNEERLLVGYSSLECARGCFTMV